MTDQASVPSRYRIKNIPSGFLLEGGENRNSVRVELKDACWEVSHEGGSDSKVPCVFSLVQTKQTVEKIAHLAFLDFKTKNGDFAPYRLKHWMMNRSMGAIGKVVYPKMAELRSARGNQRIFEIQLRVFAASFGVPTLLMNPCFYEVADKYLIEDLFRYRAACNAIHVFGEAIYNRATGFGIDALSLVSEPEVQLHQGIQHVCDQLRNWRALFSYNGRSYPNLNHTLDKLPGGISSRLLGNLRSIKLKRVVTDRMELIVLLIGCDTDFRINLHVFEFATRDEIIRAMAKVSLAMQTPLSIRSTFHMDNFVRYLDDYPDVHEGGIVGLANKSIQYHRDLTNQQFTDTAAIDSQCDLAKPPIAIPSIVGLRFLGTSQEVFEEGVRMGHCLGRYVGMAQRGGCYLFHYDFEEHSASIQVNPQGIVVQSMGPRNTQNKATERAFKILSRWGRKFPPLCASDAESSCDTVAFEEAPF